MPKIRLTSSERKAIFRPNVMLQRLDDQESRFVDNARSYVRRQAENLVIQLEQGKKPANLTLNPVDVRGIADALTTSMIDTYALGEVSIHNELIQAEQIRKRKEDGTYTPDVIPFAAMREDELGKGLGAFYPEAGVDWYKTYTLRLAGVHSVDMLEDAKNYIIESIEQGQELRLVKDALRQRFINFSESRLENIARTETAKIYEQARYQQMVDNEDVVGYEFAAVMDNRTSAICESHDGKFIRKGQEEGWLPPLHFQCRSVLLPVFGWEQGIQYTMTEFVTPPQKGFGSTDMVIPQTARNSIFIGGIPELIKQLAY